MRTTVTLDPDVEVLVRKLMRERRLSFKYAVNQAIRMGLAPARKRTDVRTPAVEMGDARASLTDKALRLAGELEDADTAHRLSIGK